MDTSGANRCLTKATEGHSDGNSAKRSASGKSSETLQKNETDKAGGYCHKDEGLSHYQNINRGRTREDLDRMKNTYRTDAGGSSFTSQKIHTQTHEKEKKMDINPGNLLSLECWFLHAQGLR